MTARDPARDPALQALAKPAIQALLTAELEMLESGVTPELLAAIEGIFDDLDRPDLTPAARRRYGDALMREMLVQAVEFAARCVRVNAMANQIPVQALYKALIGPPTA